jgi:hypothetical protein
LFVQVQGSKDGEAVMIEKDEKEPKDYVDMPDGTRIYSSTPRKNPNQPSPSGDAWIGTIYVGWLWDIVN